MRSILPVLGTAAGLVVVVVAACGGPAAEAAVHDCTAGQDDPPPCVIQISIDRGSIGYRSGGTDARRVRVARGQEVQWEPAGDYLWAVHFRNDDSPLPDPGYGGRGRQGARIRDDAAKGFFLKNKKYKYFVAVVVNDSTLVTDDPEFMIE